MLWSVIARLFGREGEESAQFAVANTPDRRAYDLVWDRETARLGPDEVGRRMAALKDFRSGRTGPSGFENWNQRIEGEIMRLAYEISSREDR